ARRGSSRPGSGTASPWRGRWASAWRSATVGTWCTCGAVQSTARPPWRSRSTKLIERGLLLLEALAVVVLEVALAQPDVGRRDLDELVAFDELQGLLEGEGARRRQADVLVGAGRAHVRELLALRGVDDEVVLAGVEADDLAVIDAL